MKTKLLCAFVFALSAWIQLAAVAFAEGYEYKIDTNLDVAEGYATSIQMTISALNTGGGTVPSSLTLPAYGANISGLTASNGDGGNLPVEEADGVLTLRLNSLQAEADNWSAEIRYSSFVGVGLGNSYLFMIPSTDYEVTNVVEERVTINHDPELGSFVTRGPMPDASNNLGGSFTNTWESTTGALSESVGILFGDSAVAVIEYAETLSNDSLWWQTKSITLAPDTNQQRVFIDSVTPEPTNVRLDVDGNVILDYRLGPRSSVNIEASLRASISSYTYTTNSTLLINDIDQTLIDRYTELNDVWADTSLSFDNVASTPVGVLVEQIYDAVSAEFTQPQVSTPYEASEFRSNKLIGELRANGVPARLVIGASFGDGRTIGTQPVSHAWVEAYLPDVGWITLDPSFEQNSDYFGVADVQRVALAHRSYDPTYPPENLASFAISFTNDEQPTPPVMIPEISATKYMILPGIAIRTTNISMPSGVIVDNAGVAIGSSEPQLLGSLAPTQNVSLRSLSTLAGAFTTESVQYGILNSGQLIDSEILAQSTMTINYIPMIALLVLIGLYFALKGRVLMWWEKRQDSKREAKKAAEPKLKKRKSKNQIADDPTGGEIENVDMLAALDIDDDDQAPKTPMREQAVTPSVSAPAHADRANALPEKDTQKKAQAPSTQTALSSKNVTVLQPKDTRAETKTDVTVRLDSKDAVELRRSRDSGANKKPKTLIQ